ncbi:hypothetical protein RKD20_000364 [Streptomyces sp. SLBN-8D4]
MQSATCRDVRGIRVQPEQSRLPTCLLDGPLQVPSGKVLPSFMYSWKSAPSSAPGFGPTRSAIGGPAKEPQPTHGWGSSTR